MDIKHNFGKKVKEKRIAQGLTQEELSERIGISPKSLSQIELGNNFVSAENLELICYALNTSPSSLFDFGLDRDTQTMYAYVISKITGDVSALHRIYSIMRVLE